MFDRYNITNVDDKRRAMELLDAKNGHLGTVLGTPKVVTLPKNIKKKVKQ